MIMLLYLVANLICFANSFQELYHNRAYEINLTI